MNYEMRIQTLQARLRQENLGAMIVTSWENLWYLTGIEHLYRQIRSVNQMVLVVPADGEMTFIPTQGFSKAVSVEHPAIKKQLPYAEDSQIFPFKSRWQRVAEALAEYKMGGQRIGVELGILTVANYTELQKELSEHTLIASDAILREMRAIKEPEELDRIRRAARLTDNIVDQVVRQYLTPGLTERELANHLRERALEYGVEVAFTQIFSGYRTYFQNIESSDKKIEEHEILLVDYGINFRGYPTDITRAYCLGKPNPKQVETCKIVTDICLAAINMIKPGVVTGDVDLFVKKEFENRGLSDRWIHRLGHAMGISFAEWPFLAAVDRTVIQPNMVFAVEPGIYYPDFGIRIEDNIIVHENGCENLTQTPHEINVL